MYKYQCDICGRALNKKNRMGGYTLCSKHMHQYHKFHKFLDNNPRTQTDKNEYRFIDDNVVEFDVYDTKQNVVASFVIDREDLKKVKYHKWRIDTNGRIITGNCTKSRPSKELSRFILDVDDENVVVDHINGNPTDNRKVNLRICTQSQNMMNRHFMSNNTSGVIGISWDKARRRWAPEIQKEHVRVHLGRYVDFDEAQYVRYFAEAVWFKEYQTIHPTVSLSITDLRKRELEQYVIEKLSKFNFGN